MVSNPRSQPLRGAGETTSRLSLGDDAHQEEQRARLTDRLLLRILRSRYAASCFAWQGWLRSAKGTYRGNTAAPSLWPSWASTFLLASSQLPDKRILRCGTVEPPQPQARRRAPRRLSRPARPRATALLDGLAGRRSQPSIGRCVMIVGSAKLAGNFFGTHFFGTRLFRTLTPSSGPPWSSVRKRPMWKQRGGGEHLKVLCAPK